MNVVTQRTVTGVVGLNGNMKQKPLHLLERAVSEMIDVICAIIGGIAFAGIPCTIVFGFWYMLLMEDSEDA